MSAFEYEPPHYLIIDKDRCKYCIWRGVGLSGKQTCQRRDCPVGNRRKVDDEQSK